MEPTFAQSVLRPSQKDSKPLKLISIFNYLNKLINVCQFTMLRPSEKFADETEISAGETQRDAAPPGLGILNFTAGTDSSANKALSEPSVKSAVVSNLIERLLSFGVSYIRVSGKALSLFGPKTSRIKVC